jgi:hypothetical protein
MLHNAIATFSVFFDFRNNNTNVTIARTVMSSLAAISNVSSGPHSAWYAALPGGG